MSNELRVTNMNSPNGLPISLISTLMLLGLGGSVKAQTPDEDPLNKHLGPTASQPADQKPPAVQKLSQEEQKLLEQIDNATLSKALLQGKDTGGMSRVLQFMEVSRQQLAEKFNPGRVTQVVQKQILFDLDAAIEQAKKNQGQGGKGGESDNDPQSKRESGKGEQPQQTSGQNQQSGQQEGSPGNTPTGMAGRSNGAVPPGQLIGDKVEHRREWGGLPARDREEVLQAGSDQPLEKFREMIDRYYSALNREE